MEKCSSSNHYVIKEIDVMFVLTSHVHTNASTQEKI